MRDPSRWPETLPPNFCRYILDHNRDELELVKKSGEIWGREARVLYSGLCIQAYPGEHETGESAYTFETTVTPFEKHAFIGRRKVIREVVWTDSTPGTQYRENGNCLAIPATVVKE